MKLKHLFEAEKSARQWALFFQQRLIDRNYDITLEKDGETINLNMDDVHERPLMKIMPGFTSRLMACNGRGAALNLEPNLPEHAIEQFIDNVITNRPLE